MRKIHVALAVALFPLLAQAQINPNVKALEITSNPGYVLLGVQPTNITRPSTPRDFVAGLQSAMVNGRLQPNFAMEANPFNWFGKQPKEKDYRFIANDYLSTKTGPAIRKNFAVSLATAETDTVIFGNLKKGMGLGYGLRFTIFPGTVNRATLRNISTMAGNDVKIVFLQALEEQVPDDGEFKYEYVLRAYDMAVANLKKRADIADEMKSEIETQLSIYRAAFANEKSNSAVKEKIGKEDARLQQQIADAAKGMGLRKEPFARDGFILEFAYSGVTV